MYSESRPVEKRPFREHGEDSKKVAVKEVLRRSPATESIEIVARALEFSRRYLIRRLKFVIISMMIAYLLSFFTAHG